MNIKYTYSNKYINILFLFIVSAIILLFCSECSFLYPLNLWDDSNCFFTVGKSVLSGKVLYRDLFEQKGPYLYFLHTLSALISYKSFIGVYFIEIIFTTIFIYYEYKILKLFTDESVILLIPIILSILYASNNFQYGDSAEELCLPLLTIPLYFSIKNIKNNEDFKYNELIYTGICAGLVFYIKFSMIGFFIGFTIMPVYIYIKDKKIKKIFLSILSVLLGLFISTIPLIFYWIKTNSFKDFYEVYIYNNIFIYSDQEIVNSNFIIKILEFFYNIFYSLFYHFKNNIIVFLLLGSSLIVVIKTFKIKDLINLLCISLLTIFLIWGPGRNYRYYSLILDIFSFYILIPLNNFIKEKKYRYKLCIYLISFILCFLIIYFIPFHSKTRKLKKQDLPQYEFAEYINKKENASLLNYGCLDDGFYITTGIIPQTKYFVILNIPINEMKEEQDRIVKNGEVDFIVSREIIPIADKYKLVMSRNSKRANWEDTIFYLYEKK